MTDSHDDEKMAALLDRGGPEGYGLYWLLWEHVAKMVDNGHPPTLTYSLGQWSLRLHSHPNRVSKYLVMLGSDEGCGGVGLVVTTKLEDGRIRVSIPNILKYKDEYTQRKTKDRDNIPTDTHTCAPASRASDSVSVSPSDLPVEEGAGETENATTGVPSVRERTQWFEEFWPKGRAQGVVWAKIGGRDAALAEWLSRVKTREDADAIIAAAREQGPDIMAAAVERASREGGKIRPLHPRTWLHQGRCTDESLALVPIRAPTRNDVRSRASDLFDQRLMLEIADGKVHEN